MTRKRFHGLKRVKFRMTWNKYNLYNLSRLTPTKKGVSTFFQQKWASKSATRAYHGEQIREKQWQRMFTSRLNAVIPMDYKYLAEHDGSELAAGRGSGKDQDPSHRQRQPQQIPYMAMTYAPMERRLDVAIFRALFASSVRQARQFVTHGNAKVNGKKMPYPGYLLNPGDMFQVEPERVLFATGKEKPKSQIIEGRELRKKKRAINVRRHETRTAAREAAAKKAANKPATAKAEKQSTKPQKITNEPQDELEIRKQRRADMQELIKQVTLIMDSKKTAPGAKQKQALRAIVKDIRSTMASIKRKPIDELEASVTGLVSRLSATSGNHIPPPNRSKPSSSKSESASETELPTEKKIAKARKTLMQKRQNQIDESKPYATPWKPRDYMSAFAFIPRYLEVNQKICSAVYLRHPVARPGYGEVPTPFHPDQSQLAFNWYLRRR